MSLNICLTYKNSSMLFSGPYIYIYIYIYMFIATDCINNK